MHAFGNSFGPAGGEALAPALESNTTLEEFSVGNFIVGSSIKLKSSGGNFSNFEFKLNAGSWTVHDDQKLVLQLADLLDFLLVYGTYCDE